MKIPYSVAMTMGDTLTAATALKKAMAPTLIATISAAVGSIIWKESSAIINKVVGKAVKQTMNAAVQAATKPQPNPTTGDIPEEVLRQWSEASPPHDASGVVDPLA